MVVPNELLAMGPTIFELWVMETELWVMEIDDPNTPLVIYSNADPFICFSLLYLHSSPHLL